MSDDDFRKIARKIVKLLTTRDQVKRDEIERS